MKRNRSFGLGTVIILAAAEQSFGSSQDGSVIPILASATPLIVLVVLSLAGIIFLYSFKRSGPKKQKGPVRATSVREYLYQLHANRPQKVEPSFSKAAPAAPTDILSLSDPTAALTVVKALAQKPGPEAVDALISALGYCQLCQLGTGQAQSIPNEFVRMAAAQVLAGYSAANFRNLAQIMQAMEAVAQEVGRKEEEAAADGKLKKIQHYLICLKEVLGTLFGLFQANLVQLSPGAASQAQITEELRRFENEAGQLLDLRFANDPVYELLKAKSQALGQAVATP